MKKIIFFIISIIATTQIHSQIVITSADMPVPGDTMRRSNTAILDGIDYEPGGADHTWMFDELTVMSQQVDTFVNVNETPAVYQIFFNNQFLYPDYKATVAQKLGEFTAIPTLTLTDAYLFIKNTDEEIREVGYGINLDGVPLPIQYQQIDTIYRFPLEYGDQDSAHAFFSIDVPGLGFLLTSKFRKNTVDGWGTLVTPYGEFQTLRVKTDIVEYDSIYSDSIGVGFPVTRNITEYKWLANGYHEPLVTISVEAFLVTASYIDSVRTNFVGVPESKPATFDFSIYPNPGSDYINVSYEVTQAAEVRIDLYSVYGQKLRQLYTGPDRQGSYSRVFYIGDTELPAGIYFLRLTVNNISFVKKLVIR